MARILSESFIKYQNDEEEKVLSIADGLDESSKALVRSLYEPLKITSEDLSREYSISEKKQLCLRTKVRVNMTLFNCVWDAKQRLEKKGRLTNRSERFINAMLSKAVNRKMVLPYTEEEILKCNHIRQCQLKKENNCRLNRWKLESSEESILDCSPLTPNLPPAQILEDQDMIASEPQHSPQSMEKPTSGDSQNSASNLFTTDPEIWIIEEAPETEYEIEAEEIAKNSSSPNDEVATDWAEAAAQINTESMTIGTLESELQTQETESQPIIINSEDYIDFNTQVPATSTQTQYTEPFL